MKGLLIKDFQLLKSQKQSYIPGLIVGIIFIFLYEEATFPFTYLTIVLSTVTYSTINLDQYNNGMSYLMTLPVSRSGYVKEKYLLQLLVTALCLIMTAVFSTAGSFFRHMGFHADTLTAAIMSSFVAAMLMQSVMVPVLLKFGAEKSRITVTVILGMAYLIGFGSYVLVRRFKVDVSALTGQMAAVGTTALLGLGCAALILLMGISYLISLRIMKNKQF